MERTKEEVLNAIREAGRRNYKGVDIPLDIRVDEPAMKKITDQIKRHLRKYPELGRFYSDYNGVINVISVFVADYQQAKKFVDAFYNDKNVKNIESSPVMYPMRP